MTDPRAGADFISCKTCEGRFHPSLSPDGEPYCSTECAWTGGKAEIERLRAALTPSAGTKAAYMGEFQFGLPDLDEDGNEVMRRVNVPWVTIKEIMAAIRERAASSVSAPIQEGDQNA